MDQRTVDPTAAAVLAALAAGAAAVHLAMVPMHAEEWLLLGAAFAVVGWAQALLAAAVLLHPRRWVLTGGAVLAVGAVAAWAVSRTTGFPFGPQASEAEPASAIDVLCVGFEVLFAVGAALVVARGGVPGAAPSPSSSPSSSSGRRRPVLAGVAAVAVLGVAGVTSAALASPSGAHDHGHGHGDEAAEHDHAIAAAAGDDAAADHGGATGNGHHHDDEAGADGPAGAAADGVAEGEQAAAAEIAEDETSAGHDHGHGSVPNQPLDDATRDELAAQLVEARDVALRYPTVADAEAAGYTMVTTYVPLIGAHYINWSLMDGSFQVGSPEMLLYDGTDPGSRMVGLSYYQFSPAEPAGFAGPNDHWHQHIGLCLNAQLVVVGGSSISAEECARRGGTKADASNGWMVHAWVVPGWESQEGVFSPENPDLR